MRGKSVLALLNTGASKSFISQAMIEALQLETTPAEGLMVRLPTGKSIESRQTTYLNFYLGNAPLSWSFYVLSIEDNLIFGSDWGEALKVTLDLGEGTARFLLHHMEYEVHLQRREEANEVTAKKLSCKETSLK